MANAVNLDAGEVLLHSGDLVDSITPPAVSTQQVNASIDSRSEHERLGFVPHVSRVVLMAL